MSWAARLVPYAIYREKLGFVPHIVRAQTGLPRLIEAQAKLENAILFKEKALGQRQKESLFLVVAASQGDRYGAGMHYAILRKLGLTEAELDDLLRDYRQAGLPPADVALLDFCLKLSHWGPWVEASDWEKLRAIGFGENAIHEAVLVTGMVSYLCALAGGLGAEPEFEMPPLPAAKIAPAPPRIPPDEHAAREEASYLHSIYQVPTFAPFELIQRTHGYIPNFFRAQTARADLDCGGSRSHCGNPASGRHTEPQA